jgi:hypothetical protein
MRLIIFFLLISGSLLAYADKVSACKSVAEMSRSLAVDKQNGSTEEEMRERILRVDAELRRKKDPYVTPQFLDALLEERMDALIAVFDAKNANKTPAQIYTVKFNQCFKDLRSKGY